MCKEISFGFSRYKYKIENLDVREKKNQKAAADIDVGFAAKATITNVKNKAVSDEAFLNLEWSVQSMYFMVQVEFLKDHLSCTNLVKVCFV